MKFRQAFTALRALLIMTVVLGIAYPLAITGIGQALLPAQANGSLVRVDGEVVGSSLIGQSFTDAEWFHSRPSAVDNDGGASSGSNYGPENSDLVAAIEERQAAVMADDSVSLDEIPADAVTASASGLDPHISPEYARLQVARVAQARSLSESVVAQLVESMIQERDLGYLGEPTVNVLRLNIALAEMDN